MFCGHRQKIFVLLMLFCMGLIGRPAFAQIDLAGYWAQKMTEDVPERGGGPEIGDYTSMPINDATRARGDAWDAQKWEMVEHECDPHPADYAPRGPADMRFTAEIDPFTQQILAWHMQTRYNNNHRIIYMDNRPHPSPYAPHTWMGFSTGEWEGDMLKVTTTHLKEGWVRRNGLARSERATLTEYFIRNDEFFTLVSDVEDPAYLTEPFIRTSNWILDLGGQGRIRGNVCIPSLETDHPHGYVAHHLPGKNPWLNEFASRHGIPVEATRGGAETMYPEYQEKLAKMPAPPKLHPDGEKKK